MPLQAQDDNDRFFDHRREDARTDWDRGGLPNEEWEALLGEMRRRADAAGHYRYAFPKEYGGKEGSNLGMAIIREHLARKGLGLHNDLQNESSIVGNNVGLLLMLEHGSEEQKAEWVDKLLEGRGGFAFGITEPDHGIRRHLHGDHRRPRRRRVGHQRREDVEHRDPQGALRPDLRPHLRQRRRRRRHHRASSCPTTSPGFEILEFLWTFNMPTDHAHIRLTDVRVPHSAIFGGEGKGLGVVQLFFNENRIRQAASSLGAAEYCLDQAIAYANERGPVRQAAGAEPGHAVPDRRAGHAVPRCCAPSSTRPSWEMDTYGAFSGQRQGLHVQLLGQPPVLRGRRPGHAGPRRPRLLPPHASSSTSTGTTAATASPRAPRRSRCAASPATSSASWASRRRRAWTRSRAEARLAPAPLETPQPAPPPGRRSSPDGGGRRVRAGCASPRRGR